MFYCINKLWNNALSGFSPDQLFETLWIVANRLFCPRRSSGTNTGVGCHFLLQGIFPTQGLNLGNTW